MPPRDETALAATTEMVAVSLGTEVPATAKSNEVNSKKPSESSSRVSKSFTPTNPFIWLVANKQEILSGMTVSLAQIPEALAFSFVAGVDPQLGMQVSFFPTTQHNTTQHNTTQHNTTKSKLTTTTNPLALPPHRRRHPIHLTLGRLDHGPHHLPRWRAPRNDFRLHRRHCCHDD